MMRDYIYPAVSRFLQDRNQRTLPQISLMPSERTGSTAHSRNLRSKAAANDSPYSSEQ
jgi:hypothetical protein